MVSASDVIRPPEGDVLSGFCRYRWWLALGCLVAIGGLLYGSIHGQWVAGDVLSAVAVLVAVAGFTVSIWLLLVGVSVARATQRAIDDTLRSVAAVRLYAAVTELQLIEEAVETAALHDDRDVARSLLNRWRHRAGEVEGLLNHRYGDGHVHGKNLVKANKAILRAKDELFNREHSTREATKAAGKTMQAVCDDLAPVLGEVVPLVPTELRNE